MVLKNQHSFLSRWWPLVVAAICFAVSLILTLSKSSSLDDSKRIKNLQTTLHEKEKQLSVLVNYLADHAISNSYSEIMDKHGKYYYNMLEKDGFVLLIYENDSLKFWSDNSVPVENYLNRICLDNRIVKLNNGWYQVIRKNINEKSVIGLLSIKKEYPYHNKYLEDEFENGFNFPIEAEIIPDAVIDGSAVYSADGTFLFSIQNHITDKEHGALVIILLLLGLSLLFISLYTGLAVKNEFKGFVYTATALIVLRSLLLILRLPYAVFEHELFSPSLFAHSSLNPSLGDFLLNVLVLFLIAFKLFKINLIKPRRFTLLYTIITFFLLWYFSIEISLTFKSIVRDSALSFDLSNIFNLTIYSFLALAGVGFLFIAFILTGYSLINLFNDKKDFRKYAGLCSLLLVLILFITNELFVENLWFLPVVWIIIMRPLTVGRFSTSAIFLFILSAVAVMLLEKFAGIREEENIKVIAENLAAEKDPVAEYLFIDLQEKIKSDSIIRNNIMPVVNSAEIVRHLRQNYLSGYWEKYSFQISIYDTLCNPLLVQVNDNSRSLGYYEDVVNESGMPTQCPNFYFNEADSTVSGYVGKVIIEDKKNEVVTMYLEFTPRFGADINGFPELLLDKSIHSNKQLPSFSYASYKDNRLFSHTGSYSYPIVKVLRNDSIRELFFEKGGHRHYLLTSSKQDFVVVSKKQNSFISFVTSFSFLFSLFSVLALIFALIAYGPRQLISSGSSFKTRIQSVLIFVVVLSLILLGTGSTLLIRQQFLNKNNDVLTEKLKSVLLQMKQRVAEDGAALSNIYYLNYVLTRLSNINSTDIMLYDNAGTLIGSSTPKLFDEGLLSKKMHPLAYNAVVLEKRVSYLNDERIGKLEYKSAYAPLLDERDVVLGYINLPYFARESDLQQEISTFIVALINVYVFLFALSIAFALLLSERIVMPLKMLRNRLSAVKLGESNEYIQWENKDEIGELIAQYNRMIDELGVSADKLARSERESAWREMAKQVAHEIKNPLTPMKLSVQQLEKAWNDNAPGWEERLRKFCRNLVEQIDTLSGIANEFSNFAKMPKAEPVLLDLAAVARSVVDLYKNDTQSEVLADLSEIEDVKVLLDKEHFIRIMNNLLKNALQAIPEDRKGRIKVTGKSAEDKVILCVEDNGTGISEDLKSKIFTPNFTTKNSGMGLGLAMVKTMVEHAGGNIWFESAENEGTIFCVELPAVNN